MIEEIEHSLAASTTDLDRYLALVALAEIQNRCFEYPKARDTVRSALTTLEAGNIYSAEALQVALESKHKQQAYSVLAEALVGMGDADGAISAFHQAAGLVKDDVEQQCEILDKILEVAADECDPGRVMRELERADAYVLSVWFALPSHLISDGHAAVQEAAIRSGREDYLIRCYRDAIELQNQNGIGWVIQYHLASFYRRFLGDDERAYEELRVIVDQKNNDVEESHYPDAFEPCISMMCEIVSDRFRSSEDPANRRKLKKEIDSLIECASGEDSDLRNEIRGLIRVKPCLTLHLPKKAKKILAEKLEACKAALSNSIGDDDSEAFVLLAKVLALAGLPHEAEMALSCIFSAMRPDFLRPDSEDDPLEAARKAIRDKSPYGDEDLADVAVICDGKDHGWNCWNKPMYLCIDCIDSCLCEVCHGLRLEWNVSDGGTSPSEKRRLFCGKDHQYIKGPVEGWDGIKDGYMRIGEEKIKFEDWFKTVESAIRKVTLA